MKHLKTIPALLLALMMALGCLAGCSGQTGKETTTAATATTAVQPQETEAEGNHHVELLRVGLTRANDTFNMTTQGGAFGLMNYNSFCAGLFWERDENGDVQPGAIESFAISDDDRTISITIPENLYWHDGVPVTLDDIQFTFEYGRDVLLSSSLANITEIRREGDRTIHITFNEKTSAFAFVNGQTTWAKIYPKHIWENVEKPSEYTGADATIGCGPYRFVSVDQDAQISYYEAVDNYWKGELTVDKVSVKTYASAEALVMALKNDEIDAIYNYSGPIASTLFPTLEGDANLDLGISPDPGNYMLMFGYNEAPSNDLAFRQAVSYAMNYDVFGATLYGDYYYTPTRGVIASPNMGYDGSLGELTYSPEKAREILDAAGYLDVDGDGYREDPQGNAMDVLITPQYNTSRQELLARLAAILADNLAKVGIKTTLDEESMTSREAWSAIAENGGTYQLYLGYCTSGIASYIGAPMYIVNYTETGWWGTWQDPEYLDAYHAVKAVNNFDDYKAAMRELQRIISEQLPAISFAFGTSSFPYRTDRYEGWINYPGWGVINNKTWYQTVTK